MTDLASLIERLEKAEGPNYALDVEIAQSLVPSIVVLSHRADGTGNEPHTYRSFTSDVGDAFWLHETMLPDTFYFFAKGKTRPTEPLYALQVLTSKKILRTKEVIAEAEHNMAPIAILLATLRALQSKGEA
jgi:hypothetical protein